MIYQVDKILKDVRICIDENTTSESLLSIGDADTLALDEIIRSKILESVRYVHNIAPNYLLENGHNFGDAVYWGDLESGWCLLPLDFQRLVVFEMDDWERAVYTAISTEDPEYEKQRSRIKAIRGTAQRPVCAIALHPEGRVLEFYSCKSTDATVKRAIYIPYPYIDEDDGVDISERCYLSVVYKIAAMTLLTFGESERSAALSEKSKQNLE